MGEYDDTAYATAGMVTSVDLALRITFACAPSNSIEVATVRLVSVRRTVSYFFSE